MDKILGLLGLARKAGRLVSGEEPVGAAARARDARLILLAQDAAENSARRVRHFADAGQCLWVRLPVTKEELGRAVGRSSCAMAALTDIGFAESLAKRLAGQDARFAVTAEKLSRKAERAAQRRKEAEQHEKNLRTGKKRTPRPPEPGEVKEAKPRKAEKKKASPTREERKRAAVRHAARTRYEGSRPVTKGKGSAQKGKQ